MFEKVLVASVAVAVAALVAVARPLPQSQQVSLTVNVLLSALGYAATTSVIGGLGGSFVKANLKGIDLNKKTTKRDAAGNLVRPIEGIAIPEAQGTISAAVFILVLAVFIPFSFATQKLNSFPYADLAEYLATLLTITFASFLGFADDVLDLRWRHKIPLPLFATLPLLLVYYANGNETGVMVPSQLRWLLGANIELGPLFYIFLLCLTIGSTHAINIYAGVNGLEVGQSVVIATSVLVMNIVQLHRIPEEFTEYRDNQIQSLFLMIPFLAVSVALLRLNWWPAQVFVGDTYCYFAGMTLAVVSIVGHFSKTMFIFLLPQILNGVYSLPQLFPQIGVPCPRHRMPTFDASKGIVGNSYAEFKPEELKPLGKLVFGVLKTCRLVHVRPGSSEGLVQMSNLTLINFVLYAFGPCREDVLCCRLLTLQLASSILCFSLRFGLASYLFEVVL